MHNIEITIIKEVNETRQLKVSIRDLGMYIRGFRASPSIQSESGWWIQIPAQKVSSTKWIYPIEFDKSNPLWTEIENAIITALGGSSKSKDVVMEDIDDKPIDLSEIPF